MIYIELACRVVVGMVFTLSAFRKLRRRSAYEEFASWLARLPLPLASARPTPVMMIAVEAAIVILVALPWMVTTGLLLAAVTLAVFAASTWLAIRRGASEPCMCFGVSSTPQGVPHVVRDALLCAIAVIGAVVGLAPGSTAVRPAGVATCLIAAAVVMLFVVFFDDLIALISDSTPVDADQS